MADLFLKQGPLAHLNLIRRGRAGAELDGVLLREVASRPTVRILGRPGPQVQERLSGILGAQPPAEPGRVVRSDEMRIYALAKGDWLIVGRDADLPRRLSEATTNAAAIAQDATDGWFAIEIAGPCAAATLAKATRADADVAMLSPGRCLHADAAGIPLVLARRDDPPTYELFVARSLADFLWRWLEDAALEYGFAVQTGDDDLAGYGDVDEH